MQMTKAMQMTKLLACIARLDERARSPMVVASGLGTDLRLIREALIELEHMLSLHTQCLQTLANGFKNHEAMNHGKAATSTASETDQG